MILDLLVAAARASEPEPSAPPEPAGDVLAPYRLEPEDLLDRAIGTASVPVAFNWRRTSVHVAGGFGYLAELNNFNSMRGGALVRLPTGGTLIELGAAYAGSWDSPSSDLVALTPFRQPGRPDRLELELNLGVPLAEGVVTLAPRFFPAAQMVLQGYAGLRYLVYPTAFGGLSVGKVFGAILSPTLSDEEVGNLDDARLAAMEVDRGRYGVMLGLGNDVYFKNGLFVSPRFLLAVPVLAPLSRTDLYVWADLGLFVGVAL